VYHHIVQIRAEELAEFHLGGPVERVASAAERVADRMRGGCPDGGNGGRSSEPSHGGFPGRILRARGTDSTASGTVACPPHNPARRDRRSTTSGTNATAAGSVRSRSCRRRSPIVNGAGRCHLHTIQPTTTFSPMTQKNGDHTRVVADESEGGVSPNRVVPEASDGRSIVCGWRGRDSPGLKRGLG